ncbi:MAG: hypothetical protein AABW67_03085 [Nanoarchaeota archaeon]
MKYGFPYQGSKSKIAEEMINILPPADNFYDLFFGGGAITHCALLSNKWKNIIANDIQGTTSLFYDAINGKYKNEKRWISREQFFAEKDKDQYIRWLWSFGNNGDGYIFGKDIEEIKKQAHEFLFKNGYNYTVKKRIELIKIFKEQNKKSGRFELEQLERLQRLQQLQQLERLEVYSKDYREIEIKQNSIVYCDIPYNQKENQKEKYYGISFNKEEFYEWAKTRDFPVYFSSSFCKDSFFQEVWQKEKHCLMNNKNSKGKKTIIEKLFWNKKGEIPKLKQGTIFNN